MCAKRVYMSHNVPCDGASSRHRLEFLDLGSFKNNTQSKLFFFVWIVSKMVTWLIALWPLDVCQTVDSQFDPDFQRDLLYSRWNIKGSMDKDLNKTWAGTWARSCIVSRSLITQKSLICKASVMLNWLIYLWTLEVNRLLPDHFTHRSIFYTFSQVH